MAAEGQEQNNARDHIPDTVGSEQPWEGLACLGGILGDCQKPAVTQKGTESCWRQTVLATSGRPRLGRCGGLWVTQHSQVGHDGKSHRVLSPDPATKSLWDLWQVAAPVLGLSFPIYTPKVLDSLSSRACHTLTGCGVKGGDRAEWPGYEGCTSPPPVPTRLKMLSKLCGLVTSKQRSRTLASG